MFEELQKIVALKPGIFEVCLAASTDAASTAHASFLASLYKPVHLYELEAIVKLL